MMHRTTARLSMVPRNSVTVAISAARQGPVANTTTTASKTRSVLFARHGALSGLLPSLAFRSSVRASSRPQSPRRPAWRFAQSSDHSSTTTSSEAQTARQLLYLQLAGGQLLTWTQPEEVGHVVSTAVNQCEGWSRKHELQRVREGFDWASLLARPSASTPSTTAAYQERQSSSRGPTIYGRARSPAPRNTPTSTPRSNDTCADRQSDLSQRRLRRCPPPPVFSTKLRDSTAALCERTRAMAQERERDRSARRAADRRLPVTRGNQAHRLRSERGSNGHASYAHGQLSVSIDAPVLSRERDAKASYRPPASASTVLAELALPKHRSSSPSGISSSQRFGAASKNAAAVLAAVSHRQISLPSVQQAQVQQRQFRPTASCAAASNVKPLQALAWYTTAKWADALRIALLTPQPPTSVAPEDPVHRTPTLNGHSAFQADQATDGAPSALHSLDGRCSSRRDETQHSDRWGGGRHQVPVAPTVPLGPVKPVARVSPTQDAQPPLRAMEHHRCRSPAGSTSPASGVSVSLSGEKEGQASRKVECGSKTVPPFVAPRHDQWRTALAVALRRGPTVHHWGPAYGKHISSALLAAGMWQDALCRFETPAADVLAALVADRSMWRAAVAAYQASCVSFDEAQEHLQHRHRKSHCASSASSSSSTASPAVVARLEAGEGHQSASLMQPSGTVTTTKEAFSQEHPLPSRVVRGEELPQTVRLQVFYTVARQADSGAAAIRILRDLCFTGALLSKRQVLGCVNTLELHGHHDAAAQATKLFAAELGGPGVMAAWGQRLAERFEVETKWKSAIRAYVALIRCRQGSTSAPHTARDGAARNGAQQHSLSSPVRSAPEQAMQPMGQSNQAKAGSDEEPQKLFPSKIEAAKMIAACAANGRWEAACAVLPQTEEYRHLVASVVRRELMVAPSLRCSEASSSSSSALVSSASTTCPPVSSSANGKEQSLVSAPASIISEAAREERVDVSTMVAHHRSHSTKEHVAEKKKTPGPLLVPAFTHTLTMLQPGDKQAKNIAKKAKMGGKPKPSRDQRRAAQKERLANRWRRVD